MLIDFTQTFADYDGRMIAEPPRKEGEPGQPLTLGVVAIRALNAIEANEKSTGDEKVKRFDLSMRISKACEGKPIHVSVEEVASIKDVVGKMFMPIVVGQAFEMLDPKPIDPTPETVKK